MGKMTWFLNEKYKAFGSPFSSSRPNVPGSAAKGMGKKFNESMNLRPATVQDMISRPRVMISGRSDCRWM
jgi:hypothetical protein